MIFKFFRCLLFWLDKRKKNLFLESKSIALKECQEKVLNQSNRFSFSLFFGSHVKVFKNLIGFFFHFKTFIQIRNIFYTSFHSEALFILHVCLCYSEIALGHLKLLYSDSEYTFVSSQRCFLWLKEGKKNFSPLLLSF